jgi:hypothetical protein
MPSTLITARLRLVPLPLGCATSPDDRDAIARATGARGPEYDERYLW